jgi:ANTAR domain
MAATAVALEISREVPFREVPIDRATSELDAIRQISRAVAGRNDTGEVLNLIARTLLRVSGLHKLELRGTDTMEWGRVPADLPIGSAVSEVVEGITLRLSFDLNAEAVESPLKLARYVAQQIRAVLAISDLKAENSKLKELVGKLESIVARRKTLHRARALICRKHRVSQAEALLLIRRYGRSQKCSLHEIASAIVACEGSVRRQPRRVPATGLGQIFPRRLSA